MTSPILELIAKHVLTVENRIDAMEANMADLSAMKSALSALTGVVANMQAHIANEAGERRAAIDAAVAEAVANHDAAIQAEIDGVTAEIVNTTPAQV